MLLENLKIDPSELPDIEKVDFEPLERDYLWLRLTAWSLFYVISGGILTLVWVKSNNVSGLYFLLPWLALLIVTFFIEIRGFKIKGYAIRQKDISYKSGLIWFRMTSVPFNRIQHCEISQGVLGRLFELATVKVYTAGGSSSDLRIGGLQKERAQILRDYITKLSAEYE